jgi:hypothetical protein
MILWLKETAENISIDDYNQLVQYTFSTLNSADENVRKIRNLEWMLKNKLEGNTNIVEKLFYRIHQKKRTKDESNT